MRVLTIIAISLGFVLLLLVVIQLIARVAASSVREMIARRFPREAIVMQDELASNFGRTSKGPMQGRGSGGLVLTADTLFFLSLAGEEVAIPRAEVTSALVVDSHLGKTIGRPLILIEFGGDSIAFFVRDAQRWVSALK